jgi:amino acid transporter
MTVVPTGQALARKSIGPVALFFFAVGASAPMTVLAGGVVATYASTGVIGVPLSFLVLAGALGLFTVGYVAAVRRIRHAAAFYALVAQGLGRVWGVAAGMVALVAYNCIQISLYGLLGASVSGLIGGVWWVWAYLALAVVATLGVLHIDLNARLLAVLLIAEIGVILMFDLAGLAHPAGGLSLGPLLPSSLLVNGIGGVFALGIAAFIGYESGAFYGEEARSPQAVARATFGALAFVGAFYAVSSWAMAEALGTQTVGSGADAAPAVVSAARDPGSGIPFSIIQAHYGPLMSALAQFLLITSILAAMISFHNSVARYVFAMARERVLPVVLGGVRAGVRGGAPIGGSLIQSAVAFVVVSGFVAAGADPFTTLFTWLSTAAAIGVLVLMVAGSLAVIGFFRRDPRAYESGWQRTVAPGLGAVALFGVLAITVSNVNSLLGVAPGSALTWILPGIVVAAAVAGAGWGLVLRGRPLVWRGIGVGEPEPLAVPEHDLRGLQV